MGQRLQYREVETVDEEEHLENACDDGDYEDAAAGELRGCLDRLFSEVADNPDLIDDLRWELDLMKIRLGRAYMH